MLDFIWESLSESFFTFGIPILIIILFYGAYEIYAYKKTNHKMIIKIFSPQKQMNKDSSN